MVITDGPNLETLPGWYTQRGPNINAVDVYAIQEQEVLPGGPLEETIIAPAYGGALCSLPRPIPVIDGQPHPYVEFSYQFKMSASALALIRNFEADWIGVWPGAPNSTLPGPKIKANGSTQHCLSRGGMIQMSGSNPWTDTGNVASVPPPDTFVQVVERWKIDWVNGTITPVYMAVGNLIFTTFAAVFNLMSFLNCNWTRGTIAGGGPNQGVCVIQFQIDNNGVAGEIEVFICAVMLRWADNAKFQ